MQEHIITSAAFFQSALYANSREQMLSIISAHFHE